MTLVVINNRGGPRETISAINLAAALFMKESKALLVDLGILLRKAVSATRLSIRNPLL